MNRFKGYEGKERGWYSNQQADAFSEDFERSGQRRSLPPIRVISTGFFQVLCDSFAFHILFWD